MWLLDKKNLIYNPITKNTEQHSMPGNKLKKVIFKLTVLIF